MQLDSLASRDALRITVRLISYSAGNPTATTLVQSQRERVMDGTDGDGTCANADTDTLTVFRDTKKLFEGKIVFRRDAGGGNAITAR